MRSYSDGIVRVNAVSGTHVVLLGLDIDPGALPGLLGFAIQREDFAEDERTWLRSMKTFPDQPGATALDSAPSRTAPFQTFQWADYTAQPGRPYEYRVFPVYGRPGDLRPGEATVVRVTTETAADRPHSVHFNRAAIASQAYAVRYHNRPPFEVGPPALAWLARDLLPGLLGFIGRAAGPGFRLRAAFFETQLAEVTDALGAAAARGADVALVFGAQPGTDTTAANLAGLAGAAFRLVPRAASALMHHKFIVLEDAGGPAAVWTGSANLSANAVYGQFNVGHIVDDRAIAAAFADLWQVLEADPDRPATRAAIGAANPVPPPGGPAVFPVFSPRQGRAVFDWYIARARAAESALFMCFPFGIVADFRPLYLQDDEVLRFALLEKYANGGNAASRARAFAETMQARRRPNVVMALGARVTSPTTDGWLAEADGLGTHVNWVHTKFMLVDPLGPAPVTITGSANWSLSSVETNDENMIVIEGDARVAHIYLTEYLRVFSHHAFREALARHVAGGGEAEAWTPRHLDPTDGWTRDYFDAATDRFRRRRYFAAPPPV